MRFVNVVVLHRFARVLWLDRYEGPNQRRVNSTASRVAWSALRLLVDMLDVEQGRGDQKSHRHGPHGRHLTYREAVRYSYQQVGKGDAKIFFASP